MAPRLVVGEGTLPATVDVLRHEATSLRRTVDDLDGYLRALSSSWSGDAATAFARQYASWSSAAAAVRDDLTALVGLVDLADANVGEATRAGLRAWSAVPRPDAVVAMAAGGAAWVDLDVRAMAAGAHDVSVAQSALAAAGRSFAHDAGIAGDDAALAGWRTRYDALAHGTAAALAASTTVLAGVADGLTDTAGVYLAADRSAAPGASPRAALPRPTTAPAPAVVTPPSTGPGAVGPVPDWLAAYVPDVDPRALDRAADGWRRLGQAVTHAADDADRAMTTVLSANRGPVFDAARRYWSSVYVPCGPDTLLDLTGTAAARLATHLENLAGVVRRTQQEVLGAIEHSTPPGGDPTAWGAIRVAEVGLGFLGPVGRVGVAIVDVEELVLRAREARSRYLADVDAAVAGFDGSLDDRLARAVAGVRGVGDVAAALTGASTAPASTLPALSIDRKQIEKKYNAHAAQFGVHKPRGADAFHDLESAIRRVVDDPTTRVTEGTYRGTPVILNYNVTSRMLVIQRSTGEFVSGWHLTEAQMMNVVMRKSL